MESNHTLSRSFTLTQRAPAVQALRASKSLGVKLLPDEPFTLIADSLRRDEVGGDDAGDVLQEPVAAFVLPLGC